MPSDDGVLQLVRGIVLLPGRLLSGATGSAVSLEVLVHTAGTSETGPKRMRGTGLTPYSSAQVGKQAEQEFARGGATARHQVRMRRETPGSRLNLGR